MTPPNKHFAAEKPKPKISATVIENSRHILLAQLFRVRSPDLTEFIRQSLNHPSATIFQSTKV